MAGFDAIAHAVETAVTTRRTPLSDTFSRRAWQLLSGAFERVLMHPGDREARAAMQLGAHFAGMAIEQSMLGAAHACANPLTARYNIAHGLALGDPAAARRALERAGGADRYAALARLSAMRESGARAARAKRSRRLARAGGLCGRLSRPRRPCRRAPGARRAGRRAMDRHLQPAAVRRGRRARDLSGGVLMGVTRQRRDRCCRP